MTRERTLIYHDKRDGFALWSQRMAHLHLLKDRLALLKNQYVLPSNQANGMNNCMSQFYCTQECHNNKTK